MPGGVRSPAAQPVPRAIPVVVPLSVPLVVDNIGRDQIDVLPNLAAGDVRADAAVLLKEIGPAITAERRATL